MAHYKRKRPRTTGGAHTSTTSMRKRHGLKPFILPDWKDAPPHNTLEYLRYREERRHYWPDGHWFGRNWPRWWDILFHTRPARRRAKQITRNVMIGKIDPDGAVWPKSHDKHCYYW
jgi:hypothetical protein